MQPYHEQLLEALCPPSDIPILNAAAGAAGVGNAVSLAATIAVTAVSRCLTVHEFVVREDLKDSSRSGNSGDRQCNSSSAAGTQQQHGEAAASAAAAAGLVLPSDVHLPLLQALLELALLTADAYALFHCMVSMQTTLDAANALSLDAANAPSGALASTAVAALMAPVVQWLGPVVMHMYSNGCEEAGVDTDAMLHTYGWLCLTLGCAGEWCRRCSCVVQYSCAVQLDGTAHTAALHTPFVCFQA